jgi:hypothetical protein
VEGGGDSIPWPPHRHLGQLGVGEHNDGHPSWNPWTFWSPWTSWNPWTSWSLICWIFQSRCWGEDSRIQSLQRLEEPSRASVSRPQLGLPPAHEQPDGVEYSSHHNRPCWTSWTTFQISLTFWTTCQTSWSRSSCFQCRIQ